MAVGEEFLIETLVPGPRVPIAPPVPRQPATTLTDEPRWTGTTEDFTASPSVRRPPVAVRIAAFPEQVLALDDYLADAVTPLLDLPFEVPATGKLEITALATNAATLQLTLNNRKYGGLNGGANLVAGAWFHEEIDVPQGAQVNLQLSAVTSLTALTVLYREGA